MASRAFRLNREKKVQELPDPKNLGIAQLIWAGPNTRLFVDTTTKKFYQVYNLTQMREKQKTPWPKCREVCGRPLRRIHFTCFKCRWHKALEGEIPQVDEVYPIVFLVRAHIPMWKLVISKFIATIYEFFIT
jgi:hypothetical protein